MAMHVLAFDTSSPLTAVAVCRDAEVLAQDAGASTERHAQTLLLRVQACLQAAKLALSDIDLVAVGMGPGSFTGVRVGLSTAKGLALGSGVKIRGVVSLAALARAVFDNLPTARDALVAPMLDAHKGEVFAALYACESAGALVERMPPFHGRPGAVAAQLSAAVGTQRVQLAGAGYRLYAAEISAGLPAAAVLPEAFDTPSAVALAQEALRAFAKQGASDLVALAPLYLRDSDAQLPKSPLRL